MGRLKEMGEKIKSEDFKVRMLTGYGVRKKCALAFVLSYAIIVVWIIIFKCNNNEALHIQENLEKTILERLTYRLEPFVDLRYMIRVGEFDSLETLAFLFNIICFIPLGVVLSMLVRDFGNILILFSFSASAEVFQLFSGFGGFDPTDVFLNTLGAILGCLIAKPILRKMSNRSVNATLLIITPIAFVWAVIAVILTIIKFPI